MSKSIQTFFTYKYLKDAAGVQYVIFISHHTNNISTVVNASRGGSFKSHSVENLRDGSREIIFTYSGVNLVTVTFEDGQTKDVRIADIPKGNELQAPFESLRRSFSFDSNQGSKTGYNISDALYYDTDLGYREVNILPSSSNTHLDTSSKSDFYYLTSGTTAFIISSDLQNQFLEGIGYSNKGSESGTLGRIRGKLDDNSELSIITTPGDPTDLSVPGPKVYGGLVSLSMVARSKNELRVCLDPNSSNYYLNNCVGNDIPCVDAGGSFPNDCLGTALTSNLINSFPAFDGGCCTSVSGCDSFSVSLGTVTDAALDTTNGSIVVTVTGGTANYTAVVDDIELQNPALTFATQTTSSIATDTFTISSLLPGTYEITVTDSNSGTNCSESLRFLIPLKGSEVGDGDYGCKTDSNAINYDTSVTTHSDKACVFCNATTGQLEIPATGEVLGNFVYQTAGASTTNATSDPAGSSLSDGTLNFPGVTYAGPYNVLPDPNNLDFDPSIEFSSDQASPIDYQLYKLNDGFNFNAIAFYIAEGQNAKALLTSNATATGGLVSGTGGSNVFTGLAAGSYAILATYDADGTPNGSPEEEQCYVILGTYDIGQGGCTDPNADNYNGDAEFDDGSCLYVRDEDLDCDNPLIRFGFDIVCKEGQTSITWGDFYDMNPTILDAAQNGYTITSTTGYTPQGTFVPGGPTGSGDAFTAASAYIFNEAFCFDIYNANGQHFSAGGFLNTNNVVFGGTMSNGQPIAQSAGAGQIVLENTITFANGATFNVADYYLSGLLNGPGQPLINPGALCDLVNLNGAPQSITVSYNYGTYNVWQETATVVIELTVQQQQTILDCCINQQQTIEGCTDPLALNYNPAATVDDGSCEYDVDPEIPGCTDPAASNYNPLATIDDGSCEYVTSGSWLQVSCSKCDYVVNDTSGYATQGDCESAIDISTDCCIIQSNNFDPLTMSSGGSSSILNTTTGLCDDLSTGSLTVTLPTLGPSGLNLLAQTTNISYIWIVVDTANNIYYSNFASGALTPAQWNDYYANIATAADLVSIDGGVGADTFTVSNIPSGYYTAFAVLYDVAYDANATTVLGLPNRDECAFLSNSISVALDDCTGITQGCTDPTADNYDPNATVDDGSCTYTNNGGGSCLCPDGTFAPQCCTIDNDVCGCLDPNALNYNPAANYQDGTCPCDYGPDGTGNTDGTNQTVPACIPTGINKLIDHATECISKAGNRSYTKHITGIGRSCSDMDTWKMIIIQDLLNRKGLPCIFNCTDAETPDLSQVITDCKQLWIDNGSIYWNPNVASSGTLALGSVVRRPYTPNPNNLPAVTYIAISNSGLDIDPFSNDPASGWVKCQTNVIEDESKNYLPNFLKFAEKYCKDCGIPAYRTVNDSSVSVTDTFTSGGTTLTNNGASFNNTNNNTNLGPTGQ